VKHFIVRRGLAQVRTGSVSSILLSTLKVQLSLHRHRLTPLDGNAELYNGFLVHAIEVMPVGALDAPQADMVNEQDHLGDVRVHWCMHER